ncbi:MAG: zinc-ribbon domain-containing protein, partial [Actinomycetota bacterium]
MEQLNPSQIKKNVKQLKQRQEQYLYYLGQLAFQAGEEGKLQDTGMLEAYRVLKDIQAQMAQCDAALEQIKAAKEAAQNPRCPQCGGSLPRGAAFCASCGANLAAPPPAAAVAPVPAGKPCVSCGAPLDEDAVFCGNCGARSAGEPAAAAAPAPAAVEEAAPPLEETHACPKCGAGIAEKDAVFCAVCGAKVSGVPETAAAAGEAAPPAPEEPAPAAAGEAAP